MQCQCPPEPATSGVKGPFPLPHFTAIRPLTFPPFCSRMPQLQEDYAFYHDVKTSESLYPDVLAFLWNSSIPCDTMSSVLLGQFFNILRFIYTQQELKSPLWNVKLMVLLHVISYPFIFIVCIVHAVFIHNQQMAEGIFIVNPLEVIYSGKKQTSHFVPSS